MQRTDLLDTSDEVWRMMLKKLRAMTPEERLRKAFDRSEEVRQFRKRVEQMRKDSEEI